jgi:hypothetical protein
MRSNHSGRPRFVRKYTLATLAAIVAISIVVSCFVVLRYAPTPPEGVYYDKYMANVGPAYWMFRDGSVFIVTPESTNLIAKYERIGNDWCYSTRTNTPTVLKATILGMTIISVDGAHTNTFYIPRRYLPWL